MEVSSTVPRRMAKVGVITGVEVEAGVGVLEGKKVGVKAGVCEGRTSMVGV